MPEFTKSVFIFGAPRSGTSALSWALSKHPDFWLSDESNFIYHFLRDAGGLRRVYNRSVDPALGNQWLRKNNVSFEEFAMYIGSGFDQLFKSRSGDQRWIDQSPTYTLICDSLVHMFPESKFVHVVRNGKSVTNSMINSGFGENWATDFEEACKAWVHFVTVGRQTSENYPERFHEVRQEDFMHKPFETADKLFAFLEAKPSPRVGEFLISNWINSSFGNTRSSMPEDPDMSWDDAMKETFQRVAKDTMIALGYE